MPKRTTLSRKKKNAKISKTKPKKSPSRPKGRTSYYAGWNNKNLEFGTTCDANTLNELKKKPNFVGQPYLIVMKMTPRTKTSVGILIKNKSGKKPTYHRIIHNKEKRDLSPKTALAIKHRHIFEIPPKIKYM